MRVSHVHCRVVDLTAAARWFEQVLQATPCLTMSEWPGWALASLA